MQNVVLPVTEGDAIDVVTNCDATRLMIVSGDNATCR